MHECHLKICQHKYDEGHHANPTMAIDFFMDPNMLLVLHQIYLEIFIPWKEGFINGYQVQYNLLLIMQAPINKKIWLTFK